MTKQNNILQDTLHKIMYCDVPTIKSIAILTAENPYEQHISEEENIKRNKKLYDDLVKENYKPVQITKICENGEMPYFVINMSYNDAVKYGQRYEQESVVWGEKVKDEDNGLSMKFNLVKVIPQVEIIKTKQISEDCVDNADFYIPFFDDVDKLSLERIVTYDSSIIPKNKHIYSTIKLIKEIEKEMEMPNKIEKFYWLRRWELNESLKKLEKLILENENKKNTY